MREVLDPIGVRHTPASRTLEVTRAVRRQSTGFHVVNAHMTAAEFGTVAALWARPGRPAVVATRHFAKPHGWVGFVPVGPLLRPWIDAQISISNAVAAVVDGASAIVHAGVEARLPQDDRLRERIVLMAQRLQPEKQSAIGVRAFAASGLAADGWTLVVAGRGPEQAALEALVTELGLGGAVDFVGYRADLPALMDRASLAVAPCPIEGLGLTVLEAISGGLPVVAAGAAGHLEVLAGFEERCLFPPGDVDAAGARLRDLAHDDSARHALGAAVHSAQQRDFSLRAQAAGTELVYREVLR
jgi:glycosyltransferase involved in cell wall biosynthesis